MARVQVVQSPSGTEEPVVLRRGTLEIRFGRGAELSLSDIATAQTHVSGGPLIELAGTGSTSRRRLAALRCEPIPDHGPPALTRGDDCHGAGVRVERRVAVHGSPLVLRAALDVYETHDFIRLSLRLEHAEAGPAVPQASAAAPVAVARVFPFVAGAWWGEGTLALADRTADFAAYKNGWQSWSYAGGLPPGKRDPRPRDPTLVAWHSPAGRVVRVPTAVSGPPGGDVVSEAVGLLGGSEIPVALLAGFANADEWLGQIYLDRQAGALAACVLLDGAALAAGAAITLPPLLLRLGPPRELLPDYAGAVGRELGARTSATQTPTGWCSWYYYFTHVGEAAILENLAALRAERARLPLDVVQIDDGYQTAVGDWTSVNERFPSGMAALAARIREAGYRPGLWLAPFTALATSRLAREHPDWFVRDAAGRPAWAGENWNAPLHALDTSHPAARDWLRSLFTTLVEEWGYDYLKLDFLACGALPGRRHDPGITRARALRDGLALIRETVGDDVFLLGCGCPLLAGVGLLDALRIGPDAAPYWAAARGGRRVPLGDGHALPAMEGAVRNTLTRAWLDPGLDSGLDTGCWHNDPDCLLVRREASALTLDEIRAFATAAGLTGGMVVLSDRMAELPPDRIALAATLLPPLDAHAEPLDPFTWGIPERVAVQVERAWGRWMLVGLFNGERRARKIELTWRELGLAPGRYHAVEFWSGAYLGANERGVRVRIPPHGAAALRLTPSTPATLGATLGPEPQLVGDTFHIGQGAMDVTDCVFDPSKRTLRWHATLGREATGAYLVAVPEGWRVARVASSAPLAASSLPWSRGERGELVVRAQIPGEADFVVEFVGADA